MKLAAGAQVGPYQILEQVGRGGMATLFKAYQPALERMVAIKVLPEFLAEDPQFRERFRREAVAIAKLRHPNILAVFDHGEIDGQPYIVTEFVEGGTFAAELGKPIGLIRATEVLKPIAAAMDYAHQRGVLHRDVKPSNILIALSGRRPRGPGHRDRLHRRGDAWLLHGRKVGSAAHHVAPVLRAALASGPEGQARFPTPASP